MILAAFLAASHALALALGLGGVFARGLRLRDLRRAPSDADTVTRLFHADSVWGVAAVIWIATGLLRAFAHIEKESSFYLRNGFFHLKLTMFGVVLLLEIYPMITFIRWRIAKGRGGVAPVASAPLGALIRINDLEVALVLAISFVAALMARGVWLF